jgi:AcrR family transcriptional regulator
LFSKKHYNSVSLSEIAEKSGIKKSTIYAHFTSKEDLIIEVFENEVNRVRENLETTLNHNRSKDVEIILKQLLIRSVEYVMEYTPVGGFWAYMLFVPANDLPQQVTIRINDLKSYTEKILIELITRGIDKGQVTNKVPNGLVYLYFCLLQGNLLMQLNSKLFHMNKVIESWSCFWDGISNR